MASGARLALVVISGGDCVFSRRSQSPAATFVSILPRKRGTGFRGSVMFAIIEDGSRQYRVKTGDVLAVDYRNDVQDGQTITFDKVLLANGGGTSVVGQPVISGATVTGEVVTAQLKGLKLEIQTFHRRNASRRHTGHRQKYTRVKITNIAVPNLQVVEPAAETSTAS